MVPEGQHASNQIKSFKPSAAEYTHNKAVNRAIHFRGTLSPHPEWMWMVSKSDRRDLLVHQNLLPTHQRHQKKVPWEQLLVESLLMVSSLTGQFQSHSASPVEDGSSRLSRAIWASHVKISPFVALESRDERLLRHFTWVCFLLWDDYDITHHMCHLPTPGDRGVETQATI